jgi:hypothetical protein
MRLQRLFRWALLAAALPAAAWGGEVFRIDFRGTGTMWSKDKPQLRGAIYVFHRYPDGALMSIRMSEVEKITAAKTSEPAGKKLRPGEELVLGPTGRAGRAAGAGGIGGLSVTPVTQKSPINPNRELRPNWDATQTPGRSLPYPASPGDYREGKTLAYPPASAVQSAPGEPPMMPSPGSSTTPPKQ